MVTDMWKKMMFRYIYNKLENVYSHDELSFSITR